MHFNLPDQLALEVAGYDKLARNSQLSWLQKIAKPKEEHTSQRQTLEPYPI